MPKTIKKKINRSHKKNKFNKKLIKRKRRKTIKKRVLKGGKSTKKRKLRNKKITYKKRGGSILGGLFKRKRESVNLKQFQPQSGPPKVDLKPHRAEPEQESYYADPHALGINIEQSDEGEGLYVGDDDLGLSDGTDSDGADNINSKYYQLGCNDEEKEAIKKKADDECKKKVKELEQQHETIHKQEISKLIKEKKALAHKLASASAPAPPATPGAPPPPATPGAPPPPAPAPAPAPAPNLKGQGPGPRPGLGGLLQEIEGHVGLTKGGPPSKKKRKYRPKGAEKLGVDIGVSEKFITIKINRLNGEIEEAKDESEIESILEEAKTLPNSDEKNKIIANAEKKREEINN